MDKCRVCLANRKNLRSIFETNKNTSYAHMITSVANVKIVKDDETSNKICLSCRRQLIDVYEFKNLIERSDVALHQINNNMKRIHFNDINDIKIEIELYDKDYSNFVTKHEEVDLKFKNGENSFCYNDTTIKKMNYSNNCTVGKENEVLNVMEFLKTIKDENNEDYNNHNGADDYGRDSVSDNEYIPCRKLKKVKFNKKYTKKKKWKKENVTSKQVLIKPIFLQDYKLIRTEAVLKPKNKKSYRYMREDICPYCGKKTKSIKSHILVHIGVRKFKCEKCSKGFFTAKDLSYHMNRHVELKDFKCDKCVAAFNNKQSLQSHMLSHTDEKKYVCDTCKKAFKRKGALVRHALTHNSANKCIKCELCNMSFFTKYSLQHHMRVHTGERPYNCEICSQPYSYKHDFNRHCYKKHGIFLKRRSVYVMNEEVMKQEQALMRDLMLRSRGIIKDGEKLNPFEGPQAAMAFEQAIKALENRQIPIDFQL